ncbi:hypothetical protein Pcaca05_30060 [Pectobacterium carotovorum subsp. carotovorum]|nr:hypothetical protein Pcaca05_30060 [Pectobacterium carotovorum subsp. carotovorum]
MRSHSTTAIYLKTQRNNYYVQPNPYTKKDIKWNSNQQINTTLQDNENKKNKKLIHTHNIKLSVNTVICCILTIMGLFLINRTSFYAIN